MKISYLFLAEGFEEIEALTVVDMMRRAGMEIRTVSITDEKIVSGAHGISVSADMLLKEVDFGTAEWLILPGGMPGSKNLGGCARLVDALKVHAAAEKPLAATFVLGVNGMLENRAATCYPGFEGMLHGAVVSGRMVEIDRNIVTGKGPAAALDFASAIIGMSKGKEAIKEVRLGMLVDSE